MPDRDWPQWATVSASRNPGRDSSHWLVLIGICFLRRVPGLVVLLPRPLYFTLTGFSILSMVAWDIVSNKLITSLSSFPWLRKYPGSHRGKMAISLFEQGRFAAS